MPMSWPSLIPMSARGAADSEQALFGSPSVAFFTGQADLSLFRCFAIRAKPKPFEFGLLCEN